MSTVDDRARLLLAGAADPFGIFVDESDREVMERLVAEGMFTIDVGSYWITSEGDNEAYRLRPDDYPLA